MVTLSGSIGDNFSIPCNIELGVNTAQTDYTVLVSRRIVYDDRENLSLFLSYQNNIDPDISSTRKDQTLYRFYSSNLTLYVENFSVPSPQDVRGVKFICDFYTTFNWGQPISASTTTAVILGFRKFIYTSHTLEPS
jgi:hypothetical protein